MKFVKKNLINLFGTGLFAIVTFVIGLLLSRMLLPAGFGKYAVVISSISLISYMSTCAIGQSVIYFINNRKQDPIFLTSSAFVILFTIGIVLIPIYIIILHNSNYFGDIPLWAIITSSIYGFCLLLNGSLDQILIAFMKITQFNIIRLTPIIVLLLLIIIGWFCNAISVPLVFMYATIGQICTLILILLFLKKYINLKIQFKWQKFKSVILYGLKLNLAYVVSLLNGGLGLLMVRFFTDDFAQVGFYRLSVRIGGLLLLIGGYIRY